MWSFLVELNKRKRVTMPSTVTIDWYLALSVILFTLGAAGVLLRRNAIIIFMSVELMLNSVNINLVAFWRYGEHIDQLAGQVFSVFVIAIVVVADGFHVVGRLTVQFLVDCPTQDRTTVNHHVRRPVVDQQRRVAERAGVEGSGGAHGPREE